MPRLGDGLCHLYTASAAEQLSRLELPVHGAGADGAESEADYFDEGLSRQHRRRNVDGGDHRRDCNGSGGDALADGAGVGYDGNVVQDSTDGECLLSKALGISLMGTRKIGPILF